MKVKLDFVLSNGGRLWRPLVLRNQLTCAVSAWEMHKGAVTVPAGAVMRKQKRNARGRRVTTIVTNAGGKHRMNVMAMVAMIGIAEAMGLRKGITARIGMSAEVVGQATRQTIRAAERAGDMRALGAPTRGVVAITRT